MPRRSFKVPFAAAGETTSIPLAAQPDGSVSMTQGFGPDYERITDGTDPLAKAFPRTPYNGLMNEVTSSIGEIQQNGFPIWAADMAPYPIKAVVRYNDQNWESATANNSTTPGTGTSWVTLGSSSAEGGSRRARFTASGVFVVPQGVTTIYASGTAGGGGGGGGKGRSGNVGGVSAIEPGGGGGGSGRSMISVPLTVTPGQSIPISIGAGGSAGTAGVSGTAGGNGGNGGDTVIGNVTLTGGTGGRGGAASGAQFTSYGGAGGSPGGGWGSDGGSVGGTGHGGNGGGNPFGTGGGGSRNARSVTGAAVTVAFGFGAGGGGGGGSGIDSTANTGTAGGAGMPGYLEIEW